VWIGKRAPSGEFKDRILGQKDATTDEFLKRYNAITYDKSRTSLVALWMKSREGEILVIQRKQQQAEQAQLAQSQQAKAQSAKDSANKKAANATSANLQQVKKTYQAPKAIVKKKVISQKKKNASISSTNSKSKNKVIAAAENQYYLDLYRWQLTSEYVMP
jgi:hypothetical protein